MKTSRKNGAITFTGLDANDDELEIHVAPFYGDNGSIFQYSFDIVSPRKAMYLAINLTPDDAEAIVEQLTKHRRR